ncbi:MBL fold metallo-hydrolase [Roseobacter sp. N2S]|uniref:MBL fold metallo-hydrolase n=1 Tax=Roseobacter sp. N2S TaxID=2663844 RepID=UPI002864C51E|nr:MBL fold metallo-hydrolase [Roseobacter sp. N2S]MDR6264674.1 glyoxylase-like metal-dependent hydrolase (beta-lactamase superfamily II) [Roseobacter sp. N2S]
MADPFDRDYTPQTGTLVQLTPDIGVVTAPNGGPMTFTGTQTYVIGTESLAIVDPGPDNDAHLAALLAAINGRPVSHVVVTHSHIDHSPLSRRLSLAVDAPVLGFGTANQGRSPVMERLAAQGDLGGNEGIDADFTPDERIADGAVITGAGWALEAIHTPGHLSNHLCFAVQGTGAVLTGDHVMGWATTMVSPPDGDLTSFMASMEKMAARKGDSIYFPGHGGAVKDPAAMVAHQIRHRKTRESQILANLGTGTPATALGLAELIYTDVDPRLIPAAARNVFAHLIDLSERNLVTPDRPISVETVFSAK